MFDRVCIALVGENFEAQETTDCPLRYFTIDGVLCYQSFWEDFGPMNLGAVQQFCEILDNQLNQTPEAFVAMSVTNERKAITNAVALMGAYMIVRLHYKLDDVMRRIAPFRSLVIPFRDVSPGVQNFDLHIEDCLGGLLKAKTLGWVHFDPEGFDSEQYAHLDHPLNADLHEIVPGKFIAMKGPKDLTDDRHWHDVIHANGTFSHRHFSPAHYAHILQQFDVQVVVRLNSQEYKSEGFEKEGIAVAELFFEDCSTPPPEIVAKFLAIAESVPGAVAVHCKVGLGRTGTLIALYMMKHHGFTAREAMGWIRIVRPGSVIGSQQQFLCSIDLDLLRMGSQGGVEVFSTPTQRNRLESIEEMINRIVCTGDGRSLEFLSAIPHSDLVGELESDAGGSRAAQAALSAHVANVCVLRAATMRCV